MEQRKYAVLIYPDFSLQEVTCLTSALAVWFGEKIDVIAAEISRTAARRAFPSLRTKRRTRRTPPDTPVSSSPAPSTPFPPFSTAG